MEPKSAHLAPQHCELVRDVEEAGTPVRYTLSVDWGLCSQRHQLRIDICRAQRDPYGHGWRHEGRSRCPELLKRLWPEHEGVMRFHLWGLSGGLHYLANTVYLAGTRDCFGWEPGEQRRAKESGKLLWATERDKVFRIIESDTHPGPLELAYEPLLVEKPMTWGPNKGLAVGDKQMDADGNHLWHIRGTGLPVVRSVAQPAPMVLPVQPYLGVGKDRELVTARLIANWPEATDAELSVTAEQLEAALKARLPKLLWELKAVVESFGLTY